MTSDAQQVKIRHGWYSRKAALHHSKGGSSYQYKHDGTHYRAEVVVVPARGGSIYLTPDNREVVITNITETPEPDVDYKWDDTVYVGEITSWVGDASPLIIETFEKSVIE